MDAGKRKPPPPPPPPRKEAFDRTPRELFVELETLQQTSYGGLEWREKTRWIKYEEDVEGPDRRWGKPHVPCLSFYSLFQLRKGLEEANLLLDLEEREYPSIATRVVDRLVTSQQIPAELKGSILKVLLLNHRHNKETISALRRASRLASTLVEDEQDTVRSGSSSHSRRSTRKSLQNIFRKASSAAPIDNDIHKLDGQLVSSRRNSMAQIDMEMESDAPERVRVNVNILKKLPEDAEAAAILVGSLDFLTQPVIVLVRLAESSFIDNLVEVPIPIRFLFFLLGPYDIDMDYIEIGRSFGTLMSEKSFSIVAYQALSRGQLLLAISEFLNASIVFPPSEWKNNDLFPVNEIRQRALDIRRRTEALKTKKLEEKHLKVEKTDQADKEPPPPPKRNPLERKGKLFYGVIQDIKHRYPQYWSDIRDGFSLQVLSSCIFIFFTVVSPAITFGGIYGEKTDKYIGVGETLLASSINGAIFALFAAQPILIIGPTGPIMIFDLSLLAFCRSLDLDFLSIRVWIGIWILVIGILTSAFEGVVIVKLFTRYLEEVYAILICSIFVVAAFENLIIIFQKHPLHSYPDCPEDSNSSEITDDVLGNETYTNSTTKSNKAVLLNQPNTALLSLVLMFGTFIIAIKLKRFRNSKYLSRQVRRTLGDFGVPIAIFAMVLLNYFIKDTYVDKLTMPKGLTPSNAQIRGWLINPFGVIKPLPIWCIIAAAPASILLYILVFIEGNICQLILRNPERGLKKGSGFHLDNFLCCLINTVSGLIGAPYMSPACVRTITHMVSLTLTSSNMAPGESVKVVGCIEQRISGLTVSLLVGLAVMLYMVLNLVPMAVLLGVFLYMGVSATAGIQFVERTVLLFVPVKYFPNTPYVKYVRARKMHLFTAVQISAIVLLWIIKQSPAALGVPFVITCLVPIRLYIMPLVFTKLELDALDGTVQLEEEKEEEDLDFYEAAHDVNYPVESNFQPTERFRQIKET